MARKKHVRSHNAAGTGKTVKATGKVSVATNKIAATVAAVAVTGAFGAGAYALTLDATAFNPDGFASAFGKSAQDSQKGFQATTEQTDAQANRHDDASQDKEKSAEENPSKDAFSDLPNNGSGTTAVAVDANAKPGTSTTVNDGKGDNGTGDGNSGNPSGPVIDNGGNGGGSDDGKDDDGDNDTPGGGSDNSGGGSDTPSTPDTPSNGGGNGGNSGSGNGGSADSDESQKTQESDPEVPNPSDIPSTPAEKAPESPDFSPVIQPVQKVTEPFDKDAEFHPSVEVTKEPLKIAYKGQMVSGWDIFCSLSTKFICAAGGDLSEYAWTCERSEFANYDYFKIDGILDSEGNLTQIDPDNPNVAIPDGQFTLQYEYRYNKEDDFTIATIDYTPVDYRVYVVDGSADGKVITTISGSDDIDLNRYTQDVLRNAGLLSEDGVTLNGMLVSGWKSEEGTLLDVENYHPQGAHVVAAKTLAYDSEQFEIKCLSKFKSDYGIDSKGNDFVYWQTLTAVNYVDSTTRTLDVPKGVQLLELDNPFSGLSKAILPSTLCTLDGSKLGCAAYELLDGNLHLRINDKTGIVTDEKSVSYLAVPSGLAELVVPASVFTVNLPCECSIRTVSLESRNGLKLPVINCDALFGADVRLDVGDFDAFASKYASSFNQKAGNTITSVSGSKSDSYHIEMGMLLSHDGALARFLYNGTSMANLKDVNRLQKDCFVSNDGLETIILPDDDCVLSKGCFANGGSLKQIVCASTEQLESVNERLRADNVEGVATVVMKVSSDGYGYFEDSSDRVVVVSVPDGIEEFTGNLGGGLEATGIAPLAFENEASLRWVVTDKVAYVGSNAFKDCVSLEGVFFDERASVTLENDPFAGCDELSFVVSNAKQGVVVGDVFEPNSRCAMYCPTDCVGYCDSFTYFDEASQIGDYQLVRAGDGYIVYGCSAQAGSEPWLCLKAGSTLNGTVELPESTIEIFRGAFEGTVGAFEVNWEDLYNLHYVDEKAFSESGLAGTVTLGVDSWQTMLVSSYAFQKCAAITAVESPLSGLTLGTGVFNECGSLGKVSLSISASGDGFGVIDPNIFYRCNNLTEISFDGDVAPELLLASKGSAYRFNLDWSDEDAEADALHIDVPEHLRESYLNAWVPLFAGYESYSDYKNKVYWDLFGKTESKPSDEETIVTANEQLLPVENRLRKMMGMDPVSELSIQHSEVVNGCVFEFEGNSVVLTKVAEQTGDVLDLNQVIPDGYDDVTIGAGAFASASGVKKVIMSDKVGTIESGVFSGIDNLELVFNSATVPDLAGGSIDKPFVFGANRMFISVDFNATEESEEKAKAEHSFKVDLLVSWPVQSLGCTEMSLLYWELLPEYSDEDYNVDKAALGLAADKMLMTQENYFRQFLGMEAIADTKDLAYSFSKDFLGLDEPEEVSGQTEKTPVEGDKNEPLPDTGNTQTGNDGESAGEVGGNEGSANVDSGDNPKNDGDVKDPAGNESTENTGDSGKGTLGSNNTGSVDDVEGGSGSSAGDAVE